MYEELVNDLREKAEFLTVAEPLNIKNAFAETMKQAADAIEELQQTVQHYKGCSDDWYKEACDYKALVPKWIPVTERLPKEYVGVLCYCSRNGQYGCGEWCKEDNGTIYWIGLNGMIPTHWMPPPEPPKEET